MTNAELIDGLRCCAESTNVIDECAFEDCPYHPHSWSCIDDMLRDAADALEAADEKIADYTAAVEALDDSNDVYIKENERLKKRIAELMPKEFEWIFEKGDGTTCVDGWICTNCKRGFHTNVPYFEDFNYCPNCGAKMKGEKDGES